MCLPLISNVLHCPWPNCLDFDLGRVTIVEWREVISAIISSLSPLSFEFTFPYLLFSNWFCVTAFTYFFDVAFLVLWAKRWSFWIRIWSWTSYSSWSGLFDNFTSNFVLANSFFKTLFNTQIAMWHCVLIIIIFLKDSQIIEYIDKFQTDKSQKERSWYIFLISWMFLNVL